ncbi:tumor necrosis factor receptor superfamily member 27 [Megalops cyprinoides]|uniref:tumor necrosis factor receptor superfamily member 27 n=1 Tax=Megalops cyprinoides TaxID=118141 RepID=UPI00186505CC|nr:tumor necrosis factor receptor superfamily member 27 [Megalops cyprinoides]
MDCSEKEYYYKGECHICQQCGPGQELSEECGYGSGAHAYCTSCNVRFYKEDWGHHNCKLCQSCKRVNRHELFPCTTRSNAVCGECLLGFYSKTRIDGLQDVECMPCVPSSGSERQCSRSRGVGVEKVWSSQAPPPQAAVAAAICGALVTVAVALSVLFFVYCRCTSFRKLFKGRDRSQSGSHSECNQATTGNVETLILNLEKEVQVSVPCKGSAAEDSPTSLRSCLKVYAFPGPSASASDHQPRYASSLSETQPLMVESSTCSNCCLGCVSQRSSESTNSREYLMELPRALFDEANLYCASDQKERRRHAPVECTELDFNSSIVVDGNVASAEITASKEATGGYAETLSEEQLTSPSAHPMQSNNSCLNRNQQCSCNNFRCSNMVINLPLRYWEEVSNVVPHVPLNMASFHAECHFL